MIRTVPQIAIDFIAEVEACVLRVYDDRNPRRLLVPGDVPEGTLTAGYGHTGGLSIGQDVTDEMAKAWLETDVYRAAKELCSVVSDAAVAELTEHQYGALLSFVFNLGTEPSWTIWKRLNAKQFDQVPLEMMKFVNQKVNGVAVKVQGLVNRRAAEVAFWATEEPGSSAAVTMPSSITRLAYTPPTASDPVPAVKSKALIAGAIGTIAGAGPMIDQVSHAITPYAAHSGYVQKALGILAAVAAACAAIGLFYMWLQKRNARN